MSICLSVCVVRLRGVGFVCVCVWVCGIGGGNGCVGGGGREGGKM